MIVCELETVYRRLCIYTKTGAHQVANKYILASVGIYIRIRTFTYTHIGQSASYKVPVREKTRRNHENSHLLIPLT